MPRATIDFGIDLGTTNSTIAVVDGVDAKVIPNKGGSGITPSAVWIDKRGTISVGFESKQNALIGDPDNADLEFKLRMGSGINGKKVFIRSGREMLPEELSAAVLKELKNDVQTNMSESVRAAVITVPAAFELPQTNATQKAAQLAGFARSPLLLEPVAASLAYGFQTESDNVYWLVYDFGGGTFDTAVMRVRDGLIQVVNHNGDNHLGGKLLDWDIVTKKLIPAITSQFNLPDFRRGNAKWKAAIGKMKYYAELSKIEVCRTRAPHEMWIENICEDADGKMVDFAYNLTPEDVEDVSNPYIERSMRLCRKTLEDKGLTGSNMERVLMVGGTTLNPWVRDAVQAELGSRLEFSIDPVTVVARGAAIFASTQPMPNNGETILQPKGTWSIKIEHEPVGNIPDPDIGGRVMAPDGQSATGFTLEFVDTKTMWRSGRITLGAECVFMMQLFADQNRRCEYTIELCDTTGTRIPISPSHVVYTIGIVPDKPPASKTIGVGLANDTVGLFIEKGTKLPARQTRDVRSTVPLRAGNADDVLRIPVIEGENRRATRNHPIGTLIIKGSQVRRDLPIGSLIEVTIILDESQKLRVQALVQALDEDFEKIFELDMQHSSLEELRNQAQQQNARLVAAREKANRIKTMKADAAISHIDDEQLVDEIDSLMDAASQDQDALAQLDRRMRDLTAAVDDVEDAVEWPALLERSEGCYRDAEKAVNALGDASEKNRLRTLENDLKRAIDAGDPDLLCQCADELDGLWFQVADRQSAFHVGRFNHLVECQQSMRDSGQAEQLIAQGRRAINCEDIQALKAANRQLMSMLPRDIQIQEDDRKGTVI